MIPVLVEKINKVAECGSLRFEVNEVGFAGFYLHQLHYKVNNYPLTKINKFITHLFTKYLHDKSVYFWSWGGHLLFIRVVSKEYFYDVEFYACYLVTSPLDFVFNSHCE